MVGKCVVDDAMHVYLVRLWLVCVTLVYLDQRL